MNNFLAVLNSLKANKQPFALRWVIFSANHGKLSKNIFLEAGFLDICRPFPEYYLLARQALITLKEELIEVY